MSQSGVDPLVEFKERLDKFISSVTRDRERRIAYGNLRHEYSEWDEGDDSNTNVAVIYETPGGSTVQINVTWEDREFSYLSADGNAKSVSPTPDEPLHMIAEEVKQIPERRMVRIYETIDAWCEDGMCNRDVLTELNKILQSDFLGGTMTQRELKLGIKHAMMFRNKVE